MSTKPHPMILNWIFVLVFVAIPIKEMESRKLDESPNGSEKCTPCESGYTPSPPLPSPPQIEYYSPPPPSPPPPIVYPSPPPPSPKKSPSTYCPPPPSSSYIYMTGPPGNLYPVDENFSGASPIHRRSFAAFLALLVGLLLGLLVIR